MLDQTGTPFDPQREPDVGMGATAALLAGAVLLTSAWAGFLVWIAQLACRAVFAWVAKQ